MIKRPFIQKVDYSDISLEDYDTCVFRYISHTMRIVLIALILLLITFNKHFGGMGVIIPIFFLLLLIVRYTPVTRRTKKTLWMGLNAAGILFRPSLRKRWYFIEWHYIEAVNVWVYRGCPGIKIFFKNDQGSCGSGFHTRETESELKTMLAKHVKVLEGHPWFL